MKIPDSKIAVTLYNLRDYCKTESDLDRTLARVRAIGYEVVQVSGTPLGPAVIRKYLDKNGLYCCATHESSEMFKGDISVLADKLDMLGCNFAALGSAPPAYRNPAGMRELGEIFSRQGALLAPRGIRIGYHNHHFEFDRQDSDKTLMDHFYDNTDPKFVCAELDVHWVTRGGGSPVRWIDRMSGRIPVIHFKDFTIIGETPVFCEIGEGNLDWPAIIAACERAGVRFYSIEQDALFKERDIFESIKISFDNLRKMGVK